LWSAGLLVVLVLLVLVGFHFFFFFSFFVPRASIRRAKQGRQSPANTASIPFYNYEVTMSHFFQNGECTQCGELRQGMVRDPVTGRLPPCPDAPQGLKKDVTLCS
jgi:hypothetical protein